MSGECPEKVFPDEVSLSVVTMPVPRERALPLLWWVSHHPPRREKRWESGSVKEIALLLVSSSSPPWVGTVRYS